MIEQADILKHLEKAKLPDLPTGFFNTFSDDMLHLIELQESEEGLLDGLIRKRLENDFNSNLNSGNKHFNLETESSNEITLKPSRTKQITLWVAGIAACFLIYFSLPFLTTSKTEVVDTITNEELLLAYLDEDDLVDFIIDAESFQAQDSVENTSEFFYEELEDEIFDYINELQ